jgi:hypothetical protein
LERQALPRAVRNNARMLEEFQGLLSSQGIPLSWQTLTPV